MKKWYPELFEIRTQNIAVFAEDLLFSYNGKGHWPPICEVQPALFIKHTTQLYKDLQHLSTNAIGSCPRDNKRLLRRSVKTIVKYTFECFLPEHDQCAGSAYEAVKYLMRVIGRVPKQNPSRDVVKDEFYRHALTNSPAEMLSVLLRGFIPEVPPQV